MHSNKYTFLYAIGISVITAVLLALAAEGLKPLQEANVKLDIKTSILRSVRETTIERATIEKIYAEKVQALIINSAGEIISDSLAEEVVLKDELAKPLGDRQLPLYVYSENDSVQRYVIPMQGTGLWGPIYGYISIENDFNTVYGAFFSHKSETPGLGAEIAEPPFQDQFQGKKIMSSDNSFISVRVVKKSAKTAFSNEHRVDGISGGTITSNGTDLMLQKSIAPYLKYFDKLKSAS